MNEPFLMGESATIQDSHQQALFKIREHHWQTDDQKQVRDPQEELDAAKQEFQKSLQREFMHQAPDVSTLMVSFSEADSFGLYVQDRLNDCCLYDIMVQGKLAFTEFCQKIDLPADCAFKWGRSQWTDWLDKHIQLKLQICEQNQEWYERARSEYDNFAMAKLSIQPADRLTMWVGERNDPLSRKSWKLALVNKSTEVIGDYLEADFCLLAFEQD
jgi:hypothetical protein